MCRRSDDATVYWYVVRKCRKAVMTKLMALVEYGHLTSPECFDRRSCGAPHHTTPSVYRVIFRQQSSTCCLFSLGAGRLASMTGPSLDVACATDGRFRRDGRRPRPAAINTVASSFRRPPAERRRARTCSRLRSRDTEYNAVAEPQQMRPRRGCPR